MEAPRPSKPPLSPHWAFVVQFRVGTELEGGRIWGKVEHVVSGQATHFESLDELLAFMARVLSTMHKQDHEEK